MRSNKKRINMADFLKEVVPWNQRPYESVDKALIFYGSADFKFINCGEKFKKVDPAPGPARSQSSRKQSVLFSPSILFMLPYLPFVLWTMFT
jgi:hypothetical protein